MQDKYAGRRDAAPYGEIRNTAINCNLKISFIIHKNCPQDKHFINLSKFI